ncbi:hypothetical protein R6Z07F_009243 [Ovis aries]
MQALWDLWVERVLLPFLGSSAPSDWEKMVNVLKGVLIECDPAMKQFLLYLDESNALGKKFIIQDIDDTHVFVIAELVNVLQERPALLVKKMWKRTMKHNPKIQFLKAPRIRNNQMEKNSANSFDELLVFPDGSDVVSNDVESLDKEDYPLVIHSPNTTALSSQLHGSPPLQFPRGSQPPEVRVQTVEPWVCA